eukprot:5633177-Alexandrium_andersonii.AAC.1
MAGRRGTSPGIQRSWRHGREGGADVGKHGSPRGLAQLVELVLDVQPEGGVRGGVHGVLQGADRL